MEHKEQFDHYVRELQRFADMNQHKKRLALAEEAAKFDPYFYRSVSWSALELGLLDDAETAARMAIDATPGDCFPWKNLVWVLTEAHKADAAIAAARQGVEVSKDRWWLMVPLLAKTLARYSKRDEATQIVTWILDQDFAALPDAEDTFVANMIADAGEAIDLEAGSQTLYQFAQRCVDRWPNSHIAWAFMSYAAEDLGLAELALKSVQEAQRIDSSDHNFNFNKYPRISSHFGQIGPATEYLREQFRLNPNDDSLYLSILEHIERFCSREDWFLFLGNSENQFLQHPKIAAKLARIWWRFGELDRAVAHAARCTTQFPKDQTCLMSAAVVFTHTDDEDGVEKAVDLLGEVLDDEAWVVSDDSIDFWIAVDDTSNLIDCIQKFNPSQPRWPFLTFSLKVLEDDVVDDASLKQLAKIYETDKAILAWIGLATAAFYKKDAAQLQNLVDMLERDNPASFYVTVGKMLHRISERKPVDLDAVMKHDFVAAGSCLFLNGLGEASMLMERDDLARMIYGCQSIGPSLGARCRSFRCVSCDQFTTLFDAKYPNGVTMAQPTMAATSPVTFDASGDFAGIVEAALQKIKSLCP